MRQIIPQCYDSHTHLLATGQVASMLDLVNLVSPRDLLAKKIESRFFRGQWLIGFGWDQYVFSSQNFPTAKDLDEIFPNIPIALSRIDGHGLWVNTLALEICGLLESSTRGLVIDGGQILRDELGVPTGILIDRAMELVMAKIPIDTKSQKKSDLREAIQIYNKNGFTHARDMSGDEEQWQIFTELETSEELTLYVDQNFLFEKPEDFVSALDLAIRTKKDKRRKIQSRGIKFYLDGALGSSGALLTHEYPGTQSRGLQIWTESQINEWIRKAWEKKTEVSVHALGDLASLILAKKVRELSDLGITGPLNIEHAEVLHPDTLKLLRGLDVTFHMQPCHWLSDQKWLAQKLGSQLDRAFVWNQVSTMGFPLFWGIDSPIEKPSLFANFQALRESQAAGIPSYPQEWWRPHVHPDSNWGRDCSTLMDFESLKCQVVFDGLELNVRDF